MASAQNLVQVLTIGGHELVLLAVMWAGPVKTLRSFASIGAVGIAVRRFDLTTLTIRRLEESVLEDLKAVAAARQVSMEAEARDILREGVQRRLHWRKAKLADLSGDLVLSDIETPFVRSCDGPSEVEF